MKRVFLMLAILCLAVTSAFALNPQFRKYLDLRDSGPSRLAPYSGYIYEYPHSVVYDIGCDSCHYAYNPGLPPDWATFNPQNIDDTLYNDLCWNCHNGITAPFVKTHSSLATDNSYGTWTVECRVCHEPHIQTQKSAYGSDPYVYQGGITSVSDNLLGSTGAGWTDNQFLGYTVTPNTVDWLYYSYKITSNTSDTLYVEGPIDLARAGAGNSFGITAGRLVQDTIATPSSGDREVRFFRPTGANSGSDGDGVYDGVCEVCHTVTAHFRNSSSGNNTHMLGRKCTQCHRHVDGFRFSGGKGHFTHQNLLTCSDGNLGCHGANEPPLLGDNQNLSNTTKCNNCHNSSNAPTAKSYWDNVGTTGSWSAAVGEVAYCGSCHNPTTPGYTQINGGGDQAQDVMGNNSTYGYGITGHGRAAGTYPRMSWQATTASGNPAANQVCGACHDLASQHYNNSGKRLKSGFANDNANSNCRQCHDPGIAAAAAPHMYSTYAAYQASAHNALKCTDCHDVHGKTGAYAAMTQGDKQALCLQTGCHTGMAGHALNVSYGRGGLSYSLQCVSCHNVHIVTGRISAADNTKTPLSGIANNLQLWGGAAGQKMANYAGSGIYRTPSGDTLTGADLPDYPTFCLECHGQNMSPSIHGSISWNDLHGRGSANVPNGGGSCPNWYTCGLAFGWDGDDCTGGDNVCWPVINRGYGDQLFSRLPYNHNERVAGGNFVLSCNDCHTTHSVSFGPWKTRSTINGGAITGEWKTICNSCHYYHSDWHANMSCGNANSCHDANNNSRFGYPSESIHGMSNMSGDGSTRTIDNSLVLDLRFENNLNDSGSFRLHSKWYAGAGTFAAGKVGQAITLNNATDNQLVQVGTTNAYWSTDAGYHNTWTITEMKYNTTLQAWVRPTDNTATEMIIFTKHVGVSNDGGYQFGLKKIGGSALRAVFNMAADNNASAQGGKAGIRGAYSSVTIPLNVWTHVAATFNRNGPDRNPSDRSVGRIRIYVNGIDVTTSDASGNNMQPGAGETSIFAYSENSPWNQSICYNGTWCASEFTVGGFPWQNRFTGSIDEAKVWNVTKDNTYFAAFDNQAGPYVSTAEGQYTSNQLTVVFTEGVYTNNNQTGSLVPGDFVLTDADNGRTITNVSHAAGSSTATLTLSSALDSSNDINVDTLRFAANAVYDRWGVTGSTATVTITGPQTCPTGQVVFNFSEPAGSAYALDNSGLLAGTVNEAAQTLLGDGLFTGDAAGNYINFPNNYTCLQASTGMRLEARFKLNNTAGTGTYLRRIIERNSGNANYQLSPWRNNQTANGWNYNAPSGIVSLALWLSPVDTHGGDAWKLVLTDYTYCPITAGKWYYTLVIWDTDKPGGVPGQYFVPATIYVEDQGTDGLGSGQSWSGLRDCTKTDQSYLPPIKKLYTGDVINTAEGSFAIGSNAVLTGNYFDGQIDWIKWYGSASAPPSGPVFELDYEMELHASPPPP